VNLQRGKDGKAKAYQIKRERESALLRENARTPDDSDDAEKRQPE